MTSLTFYSEVEKIITKASSEDKYTTTFEKQKQWTSKAPSTMQENPRKENSKSHMQKRKNKTVVLRSHIQENLGQKQKWKIT